jgi:hypothetical protein
MAIEGPANKLEFRAAMFDRPPPGGGAPFPMCFTPDAMNELLRTVGSRPPESGAKGFGPIEQFGFDHIEFDAQGSSRATGAVYSPDAEWGMERLRYWMQKARDDIKVWTGDLHSHPGTMGWPSAKAGKALGDLGYVEEVFAENETMQFFAMPILTQTGVGKEVVIAPWIISRDRPDKPMLAELKICAASEFPKRVFNPAWEARVGANGDGVSRLDVLKLVTAIHLPVTVRPTDTGHAVTVEMNDHGSTLILNLTESFPSVAPRLSIKSDQNSDTDIPISWEPSARDPELRLARLYHEVRKALCQTY